MKTILVTSASQHITPYCAEMRSNKEAYARRHGMDFHCGSGFLDMPHPSFDKLRLLEAALKTHDLAIWVDMDVCFTNFDKNISELLPEDQWMGIAKEDQYVCAGIMLWRSCREAFAALKELQEMVAARPAHLATERPWDQGYIIALWKSGKLPCYLLTEDQLGGFAPEIHWWAGAENRSWRPGDLAVHVALKSWAERRQIFVEKYMPQIGRTDVLLDGNPTTKDCIINVACGSWYPRGQDRLRKGLDAVGYAGTKLFWRDSFPAGKTHADVPYGFKACAFDEARKQGYQRVLWLDAALVVEKPLDKIFEKISEVGYFLLDNVGHNTGEWCSDAALATLGLEREESFKLQHLMACAMGLDFSRPVCHEFLDQYLAFAQDGRSFQGKHTNAHGEVSADKRVRGHRHDQTVASVLTRRLGMDQWQSPFEWLYYPCWEKEIGLRKPECVLMESRGGAVNL